MAPSDRPARIVIAVTESCPVQALWRAAMRSVSGPDVELHVMYIVDERWRRAASLPFTCEISRIGGGVVDFSHRRAKQVAADAAASARQQIDTLASESHLTPAFEVLSNVEQANVQRLAGDDRSVLIASSLLAHQPVFASFENLDLRIELIESKERDYESE